MATTPAGGSPHPYIPATEADRARMLARVGVADVEALFDDLPAALRDPAIDLPPALTEPELIALLEQRAASNASPSRPDFRGAGAYRRSIPAIAAYLSGRSEFATAYTPYQPEISQGTLQSGFEYQSVVCELTGMDVSNTGLYDVASATAEACLLAARVTGRRAVALLEPIHPGTAEVVRTYARGAGLRVDIVASGDATTEEHACLVAQQPDYLGAIADLEALAASAHDGRGAVRDGRGSVRAGAAARARRRRGRHRHRREGATWPARRRSGGRRWGCSRRGRRTCGRCPAASSVAPRSCTRPDDGVEPRTGYVLTLQAREQFIRRERATSNVSTAQALIALAFTVTVQALGPRGLREAATLCYQRAHAAAARIAALPGYATPERGPWFQEFLVRGPMPAAELAAALAARGIGAGVDVSARPEPEAREALLFAVTEATPGAHVDALVAALSQIGGEA